MLRYLVVCLLISVFGCSTTPKSPEPDKPARPTAETEKEPAPPPETPLTRLARVMSPEADRLVNPAAIARPSFGSVSGMRVFYSPLGTGEKIIGFSLTNTGSAHTNPTGPRIAGGVPKREYRFRFRQRARQNIYLQIHEFAIPNGNDSETSMYTSLYFFPRRVLPSVRIVEDQGIEVTLPTGEKVVYDRQTKEIISGVLDEYAPIDTSPDRHARHFARVAYTGKGILIRIDQRGETPETEFVWGRTTPKFAEITYQGRSCKVRANKLWYQDRDRGSPYFLYPTDEEFRDRILVSQCGWADVQLHDGPGEFATLQPDAPLQDPEPPKGNLTGA